MLQEILQYVSLSVLALAIFISFSLIKVVGWINDEMKIQALGGHAPRIGIRLLMGLDQIMRGIQSAMHHQNLPYWQSLFAAYGRGSHTVEGNAAGQRVILTDDPENIKALLASQFHDFGKGEPFHRDWSAFLGDSIFTTDLEQWHNSRQLIRPQFIKDRVSDLEIFEKHVKVLLRAMAVGDGFVNIRGVDGGLGDGKGRGREVDVADLFFRYTLDAATEFLFGRSVGSLENLTQEFGEAFTEVQRVQNIIARAGPLNRFVPRRRFYKCLKVINEFVNPYIEQALRLSPEELKSKSKSESGYTFLHALASFTRDRKVLRDQLVAVLLAGRDTTAATLSWTFYELARHHEVVQRLRQEIIATVGSSPPTYEDLKNMRYLQQTMNETLRLYPVVPFNMRLALCDTTLPHGGGPDCMSPVGVLKDTVVGYSALTLQRRQDLFPAASADFANINTFSPERWTQWTPKAWTYIPFNGGPRICIGQQFALTEMGYTIVRVLQRFGRVEDKMPKDEGRWGGGPCLKAEIVLQPGEGVRVGFWEGDEISTNAERRVF